MATLSELNGLTILGYPCTLRLTASLGAGILVYPLYWRNAADGVREAIAADIELMTRLKEVAAPSLTSAEKGKATKTIKRLAERAETVADDFRCVCLVSSGDGGNLLELTSEQAAMLEPNAEVVRKGPYYSGSSIEHLFLLGRMIRSMGSKANVGGERYYARVTHEKQGAKLKVGDKVIGRGGRPGAVVQGPGTKAFIQFNDDPDASEDIDSGATYTQRRRWVPVSLAHSKRNDAPAYDWPIVVTMKDLDDIGGERHPVLSSFQSIELMDADIPF